MEATATKPKGNPNFGKKPTTSKPTAEVDARFKLIKSYDKAKPVDGKTNQPVDNPYPQTYIAVNAGVAYDDDKGELRQWRYLFGYPTIWVDEQIKPIPNNTALFSEKNDIIFKGGFLRVSAKDKAKLQALMLNDAYAGNESPVNDIPKVFEIIDDEATSKKLRNLADVAFEAESEARNCTDEEMMPIAELYGIDTELDPDNVRTQFIFQAKSNPNRFLENFSNPKNKIKYTVTQAIKKGLIEATDNKVVFMETGKPLFEVNSKADVAEQIADMVLKGEDKAIKLIEQLNQTLR